MCIDAGGEDMKMHMNTCLCNQDLTNSCLYQRLHSVADVIEVQANGSHHHAVIADKVSDVSTWQQLGLILWYVRNGKPTKYGKSNVATMNKSVNSFIQAILDSDLTKSLDSDW